MPIADWYELVLDRGQTIASIAARERKSERSIRMTLSLAFVAPPIIAAAVEGRLPRGFGAKRLLDLPIGLVPSMDRARPQGAGSDLIEGQAVTTSVLSQISISK